MPTLRWSRIEPFSVRPHLLRVEPTLAPPPPATFRLPHVVRIVVDRCVGSEREISFAEGLLTNTPAHRLRISLSLRDKCSYFLHDLLVRNQRPVVIERFPNLLAKPGVVFFLRHVIELRIKGMASIGQWIRHRGVVWAMRHLNRRYHPGPAPTPRTSGSRSTDSITAASSGHYFGNDDAVTRRPFDVPDSESLGGYSSISARLAV